MLTRLLLGEFGVFLLVGACVGAGQILRAHGFRELRPRSPEDYLLLLATLVVALRCLLGFFQTRGRSFLPLETEWLWGFGAACVLHLILYAHRARKWSRTEAI